MDGDLKNAIVGNNEALALQLTDEMLERGDDPLSILDECRESMFEIGKRFETGEAFLPELIMGGVVLDRIAEKVKPFIKEGKNNVSEEKIGKALIGTVSGDIHYIGKNIVAFMLDINGVEVRDIGEDVEPDQFVEEIKSFKPDIVGLSCLLTTAFDSLKTTVDAIEAAGLRSTCKILIGGSPVNDTILRFSGADAYGKDAVEAVFKIKEYIKEK